MSATSNAIALLLKCSRSVWSDFTEAAAANLPEAAPLWEAWLQLRRAINYLEAA